MIHAYLFVSEKNQDRSAHGPNFQLHMNRINELAGLNITIFHSFHDEVDLHRVHWWQCDGPCQFRRPFYGLVKRAMNRKPGPYDRWFADHQKTCGGRFIKIREPNKKSEIKKADEKKQKTIDRWFNPQADFIDLSNERNAITKEQLMNALRNYRSKC
ncbi:hypothetical protein ACOME3_005524 [Neoechinorhynchus agilis]